MTTAPSSTDTKTNDLKNLSFFDPKTGVTYSGLGVLGALAASLVVANFSFNPLAVAGIIGVVLGAVYMLINNFTPGYPGTVAQQIGFGILNSLVLILTVFGGMAALDKTTTTDTTQLKTEDAVVDTGLPPAPPDGDLPPAGNVHQVPPPPGSSG
ncbi:hypothetical protein [Dietzia maris]|uniref:hypothetical protein n=1 Tax=Dietzia maris TaxID=37915 RepID=UPI0037C7BC68